MLRYNIFPEQPILDPDKLVFTRGKYQFESLEDVAAKDIRYLIYLVEESGTDEASIGLVEEFMDEMAAELERIQPSFDFLT